MTADLPDATEQAKELAMKLFEAFWAAADRIERPSGHPKIVTLTRHPDCEMPPRLWVYMAEAIAAMDRS